MESVLSFALAMTCVWLFANRRRREWFILEVRHARGAGSIPWCRARDENNQVMQPDELVESGYERSKMFPRIYERPGGTESIMLDRHAFENYEAAKDAFQLHAKSVGEASESMYASIAVWRIFGWSARDALKMVSHIKDTSPVRVLFVVGRPDND